MRKLWVLLGRAVYWLSWPALWVILYNSRRTRILLVHEGRVLVLKSWLGAGKWMLPGGGLHRGEEGKSGAIREVFEETGIQLTPEHLESLSEGRMQEFGFRYNSIAYVAELSLQPEIRMEPVEVIEYAWLPAEQLTKKNAVSSVVTLVDTWKNAQN